LLAGSAGPPVGVNAVAIADAVQVVVPPRWSLTVTTPSAPEIVVETVDDTSEPRSAFADGVLIDNVPASRVKDIGVAAEAEDTAAMVASKESAAASEDNFFLVIAKTPNLRPGFGAEI
jgi:hypothetical protein